MSAATAGLVMVSVETLAVYAMSGCCVLIPSMSFDFGSAAITLGGDRTVGVGDGFIPGDRVDPSRKGLQARRGCRRSQSGSVAILDPALTRTMRARFTPRRRQGGQVEPMVAGSGTTRSRPTTAAPLGAAAGVDPAYPEISAVS